MAMYESDTADAEFVVKVLTDFVNRSDQDHKEFAEELGRQHRTLQQGATRLFMDWMKSVYDKDIESTGQSYDLRNQATVILARKMFNMLDESDFYLPHV